MATAQDFINMLYSPAGYMTLWWSFVSVLFIYILFFFPIKLFFGFTQKVLSYIFTKSTST